MAGLGLFLCLSYGKKSKNMKFKIIKKASTAIIIRSFDSFFYWRSYAATFYFNRKLKKCGQNVKFRFPVSLEDMENIEIGDNVSLASFVHIWGGGGVSIGDNTMIASHTAIFSTTHDYEKYNMRETVINKPVKIGRNVWIGTHAIIYPGIVIGDGAVIGANTLVNKNVPENVIFYGSPGRVVKSRIVK